MLLGDLEAVLPVLAAVGVRTRVAFDAAARLLLLLRGAILLRSRRLVGLVGAGGSRRWLESLFGKSTT